MTLNRNFAIALGVTALFGAAVAQAEELNHINVTFAFEANGQRMAPGSYSAARSQGGSAMLRNVTTGQAIFVVADPTGVPKNDNSSMTFVCYGSDCFLSKLQFGQSQRAYQVPRSKHEKELARTEQPKEVLVAMR